MLTLAIGLALGLFIGAACRYFDLPLPAPPKLVGALLVVAMTLGFLSGGLVPGA
jgi:XapX domain-containing protein